MNIIKRPFFKKSIKKPSLKTTFLLLGCTILWFATPALANQITVANQTSSLETMFPKIVSGIIEQDYIQKNLKNLKNYMEENSLEELFKKAEHSDRQAQSMAALLHYLLHDNFSLKNLKDFNLSIYIDINHKQATSFKVNMTYHLPHTITNQRPYYDIYMDIERNPLINSPYNISLHKNDSQDDFLTLSNLVKNSNTADSKFVLGVYHLTKLKKYNDSHRTGEVYLKSAKKQNHALAYLFLVASQMKNQKQTLSTVLDNTEVLDNTDPLITAPKTKKENVELLEQTLQEMQNKNITHTGFNFLMGTVSFIKNQYNEATSYFELTIKNNNVFSPAALGYLGLIHKKQHNYKQAEKYFLQAIKQGSDIVQPELLDVYIKDKNYKASTKILEEMATFWGKYNDTAAIRSSLLLSYMLAEKKNYAKAYEWALRAKTIQLISQTPELKNKIFSINNSKNILYFTPDIYNMLKSAVINKKHSIAQNDNRSNHVALIQKNNQSNHVALIQKDLLKKIPTNTKEIPTNTKKIPTNTKKIPTNTKKIPTNTKEIPTNTKEIPIEQLNFLSLFTLTSHQLINNNQPTLTKQEQKITEDLMNFLEKKLKTKREWRTALQQAYFAFEKLHLSQTALNLSYSDSACAKTFH